MRIWEEDKDYEKEIQEKAAAGDYRGAAESEKKRNAKIQDLGLDYAQTNRYGAYLPFEHKEFDYDYNNDNSYKAYAKEYTRNMQRAVEDTMGKYAGMTGGLPSTAAMSAATQAGALEMQKLTDKIPELEQMAYQRWANERNQKYNEYLDTREFDYRMRKDAYNKGIAERDYQDKMRAQELERAMEYGNATGDFGALPDEWYTPEAIDNIERVYAENEEKTAKEEHEAMFDNAIGLANKGVSVSEIVALYPDLTAQEQSILRVLSQDVGSSERSGAKIKNEGDVEPKAPEETPINEMTFNNNGDVECIVVNGRPYSYEEVEYYMGTGEMKEVSRGNGESEIIWADYK